MFRKILKYLAIVQEVSNRERSKQGLEKIGGGFIKAYRFNPYNPLSYITIIITIIIGIVMFGVVGFWKETDLRNPFKWN